jgi:phosphoribosyl-dephospho-CoA transferase
VISSTESQLLRHDLVWLDETRWRQALLGPLPDQWLEPLSAWFSQRRPAVVRRQECRTAGALGVGVALPPSRGKLKLPLLVDQAGIVRSSGPLQLAAAAASAPIHWRPWLEGLLDAARGVDVDLRVYGSLAWQHLSGESYVTPTSDLDLLWSARDHAQLAQMLEIISEWQQSSGLSADGELLLLDGAAVAWKELLARPCNVLVKRIDGVELRPLEAVLALLMAEAC